MGLGALFVKQDLFNTSCQKLNSFTTLSLDEGSDNVTILTDSNYIPDGRTALYKALHSSLQDLLAMITYARSQGLSPTCSIALITNGEDTEGGVDTEIIRNLFLELQEDSILRSSVLIYFSNNSFTQDQVEKMQNELGFKTLINGNDRRNYCK